jgi:predicted SAM-dependent methyltransferase
LARIPSWISRQRYIENYFRQNASRKLHLAASDKPLAGWLNTDLDPIPSKCIFLDATKRFPFPDASLDFVYSEHFVEHISPEGAAVCFAEVFRCLKPGGVFRIATPDLTKYAGLFQNGLSPEQNEFLKRFGEFHKLKRVSPCAALNYEAYHWGHCFLYTREELVFALNRAGFDKIVPAAMGQSQHAALHDIEQHWKIHGGFEMNEFETFVVEASK